MKKLLLILGTFAFGVGISFAQMPPRHPHHDGFDRPIPPHHTQQRKAIPQREGRFIPPAHYRDEQKYRNEHKYRNVHKYGYRKYSRHHRYGRLYPKYSRYGRYNRLHRHHYRPYRYRHYRHYQ